MSALRQRIALGMSGGVDSSVAVALLQRAGYDVLGVTCRFVDDEKTAKSIVDAVAVCERFGIPHEVWECAEAFEERVVQPFVETYACGLTPSPCVGCNAVMKIPALLEAADAFGCTKIATGHYARVVALHEVESEGDERSGKTEHARYAVLSALDYRKDQSYMLCMLSQEQLSRLVLPLGGVTKTDVRIMAEDLGLTVADKPESQDVCFIEGDYRDFLRERGVADKPGAIVNTEGVVVGSHTGLFGYTIGQRKGIGVAAAEPYYVLGKRIEENELVVGFADAAKVRRVVVGGMNWQAIAVPRESFDAMVKLRYRSEPAACTVESNSDSGVLIHLASPQSITAPGQYAVLYQGSMVLGGGIIQEVLA